MEHQPVHSPLGASGAERWMECPGSVALLKHLDLPESDDPDYRRNGTAAHAVAAMALQSDQDAWEFIGETIEGVEIDDVISKSVQVYLDRCREREPDNCGVEFRISNARHPQFYGTCDRWEYYEKDETLVVRDFKHGEGIQVDVENNPQVMYYAYGVLGLPDMADVHFVNLEIVQPRGFHHAGPIRSWQTTAEHIREWAEAQLFPAMNRTAIDATLNAGPWCRFCPAKLVCPLMVGMFGAAMVANPSLVKNLSDESLGLDYQMTRAAKFYIQAVEEEAMRRCEAGIKVPHIKLVHKKANRMWNSDAEPVLKARFGGEAYTEPKLKSPPEIEKLGTEAAKLVKEYAYTPASGLTIALDTDPRGAVKVTSMSETFAAVLKQEQKDRGQ